MEESDFKRRVVSAVKWTASMRVLSQILSWLSTLVVIRLLSPADYGSFALAMLVNGVALLVNEVGLPTALVQSRTPSAETISSVHGFVLLINVGIYALVYAIAPLFAHFYNSEDLVPIIRVLGLQLIIGGFGSVPNALAKRALAFKSISVTNLLASVSGALVSLVVANAGGGVWALVFASLIAPTVQTIGMMFATRFRNRPTLNLEEVSHLFHFGAWVSASRIAWYVAQNADDLIIGKLFTNEILGIFNVAKNLAATPLNRIMEILNQVTFPVYSRLDGNRERVRYYLLRSIWLAMLVLLPITLGISSVANVFTSTVLGPRWDETALPLRILSFSIPLQAIGYLVSAATDALGEPKIAFRNSIVRLIVYPLCVAAAVPWGILGISVLYVVARAVTLMLLVRNARPILAISARDLWDATRSAVVSGLIMYAAVSAIIAGLGDTLPAASTLCLASAVGAIMFLAAIRLCAPDVFSDVRSVLQGG